MDRNYVIVCNRHKGLLENCLLFWGAYTKDNQKRCFGGYTINLNKCERYTLEEAKNRKLPIYGIDLNYYNYEDVQDFVISIDRLEELDCKSMLVYAKQ